jgi:gliding motility-associated-like protein
MKPARLIALASLYLVLIPSLAGQDETQPLSPHLDMVTVDPLTGFATVSWLLSASPDVGSYVIYTYESGRADAVDTVRSPVETFYIHTASQARYRSVTYVVAAIDSSLNVSPLSNSLSTVFLSAANDTCNNRIVLSWTPYNNLSYPADSYEIRVASGGGPAALLGTVPSSVTSYIYTGFDPGTPYCIHIRATHEGAALSLSNNACLTTGTERAPSWIRSDAVAVTGQALQVSGSYDEAATPDDFLLHRYNPVTSTWETAASAAGINGTVSFTVTGADTTVVSLYRISVLNNCNIPVATSGDVRNMVLASSVTGTQIDLVWNNPLPESNASFDVWRDTGQGWEEVAHGLSDTLWSDDYAIFARELTTVAVAYQVTSAAPDAPAGAPLHRSSVTLVQPSENIFFPNAFIPDATGENALFKPEFSFIPVIYDLRVYSRSGVLLFQTSDHATGWDGRHGGEPVPSGVYLWSLRLTTPSGNPLVRNGTVTILP